ncbi:MAG: endonuclease/exonuclease/phosphatase family protein [Phycisphaerales bacterium]|nr:MAG: endonuclease/exonuclease/phosphatase family protein [Phycisphaerales bacterium]
MIRTFLFPFGMILAIIAILGAYGRARRLSLAVLPVALFAAGPECWQYRPRSAPLIAGETVKVMSVNLLMVNENTRSIIEEIQREDPDILLLQEYTPVWHKAIQASIGEDLPHVAFQVREDSFGTAIYSNRPFEGPVEMYLPLGSASVPQMRVVIAISDRPVAFYNVHLLPPSGLEYTIENRLQFADLAELLSTEPLPVAVGGDFNFTQRSPQAAILRKQRLVDAHNAAGLGRGTTWPMIPSLWWMPSLRLDHLYIAGGLTCAKCQAGIGAGSDHRPVIGNIGFAR